MQLYVNFLEGTQQPATDPEVGVCGKGFLEATPIGTPTFLKINAASQNVVLCSVTTIMAICS